MTITKNGPTLCFLFKCESNELQGVKNTIIENKDQTGMIMSKIRAKKKHKKWNNVHLIN